MNSGDDDTPSFHSAPAAELNDLRVFALVVDEGTMSGAARRHGLPKATVSRAIARLEAVTGSPLFDRTGRGLRPTSLGVSLIPAARSALAAGREAEAALRARAGEPTGPLRILASALASRHLLAAVIAELIARHPGVRPELIVTSQPVDPLEEDHDITVRIGRPSNPKLVARLILRVRLGLYAQREAVNGLDIHDTGAVKALERIVVRMEGLPEVWTLTRARMNETVTLDRPPLLTVTDPTVALGVLPAGPRTMLVPRFWAESIASQSKGDCDALIEVLPQWQGPEMEIFAVMPPGRASVPAVRAMLDMLYARAKALTEVGSG
ncbi:LysR family transcriptional regulator [Histidinibacterium aquaticum]|uniref:LysR family transcriptional regulator n=1 Tax=Histidinibacterium aquaticum TaxID=2613962 RepID=A0A5J5GKC5_9RHOB|nr:LysR family transcriptional regulator [Histidinibacterium aquaticum]KAA9008776.1 LysR family transcriptional regulator [Histidinibacterium aquaticum]